MIKIWFCVRKYWKEPNSLLQYTPICGNQFLAPGKVDATFKLCASKELERIQDLYPPNSDVIMSFEELRHKFSLSRFFSSLYISFTPERFFECTSTCIKKTKQNICLKACVTRALHHTCIIWQLKSHQRIGNVKINETLIKCFSVWHRSEWLKQILKEAPLDLEICVLGFSSTTQEHN